MVFSNVGNMQVQEDVGLQVRLKEVLIQIFLNLEPTSFTSHVFINFLISLLAVS